MHIVIYVPSLLEIAPDILKLCWNIHRHINTYTYTSISTYTGCPKRNVPEFGRVFLMVKNTNITQNTYVQS
jgi:hypothetical protein